MINLRQVRDDPDAVRAALRRRDESAAASVDDVLALDVRRRDCVTQGDAMKAERNVASADVARRKAAGEDTAEVIARLKELSQRIKSLDEDGRVVDAKLRVALLNMPNLTLPDVPEGSEDANVVVRSWEEPRTLAFDPKPHWDLGVALHLLDLPRGAKLAGSGFPVLRGAGARLNRALVGMMLDLHTTQHGYTEVQTPYLVTRETLSGTGQLPKFADESYQTERDDLWLITTAEVPITNLHRDELLSADDLPIRYVAYSPCFRREAGAAGADTRGLLRVHQFDKVELVRYETPERSRDALEELTGEAESILDQFGLHYRVLKLATGDLGFSAEMTYDMRHTTFVRPSNR